MTDYSLFKKLRFDLSGNIGIGTTRPQSKVDISGNVQILGHVTPSTSLSYDLGSSTKRWRDIYLSGNTIDLGGTLISKEANGGIKIADSLGNTLDGKFNNLVINGAINQVTRLDVSGSILPTHNLIYDLGAPDKRWNDLYLSGNTIDLSGTLLSRHVDGSLMVHDSNNNMITGRFADVTATGNIGVGTDYPLYKMHVIGDTRIQGNLIINGTTTVVDTNVNTTEMLEITNDGTGPALRVTQTGVQPIADFCDDASNNVVVRIADNGNVGIGTLTPQTKLHVMGNVKVDGDVSANNFNGKLKWTDVSGAPPYELPVGSVVVYDGIAQLDSSFVPADGQTLNRIDYPELANALNIPGNQLTFTVPTSSEYQVNWNDISTSSVSYIRNKPNVYGDENGNVDVSGNIKLKDGSISSPVLTFSSDLNTGFYRAGSDILGFVTGGSERMRIDASGNTSFTGNVTTSANVGIGTNVPRGKLQIANIGLNTKIRISASDTSLNSQSGIELGIGDIDAGYDPAWSIYANGDYNYGTGRLVVSGRPNGSGTVTTERMTILANGNVGVGVANPTAKLDVSGNIKLIGSIFSNTNNGTGTITSELLKDYEEGTWIPQIGGVNSGTKDTSTVNYGWYTKIGRQVFCGGTLHWNSTTALSGTIVIKNLPFISSPNASGRSGGQLGAIANGLSVSSSIYTYFNLVIDPGNNFAYIIENGPSGIYSHFPIVANTGTIYGMSFSYITNL